MFSRVCGTTRRWFPHSSTKAQLHPISDAAAIGTSLLRVRGTLGRIYTFTLTFVSFRKSFHYSLNTEITLVLLSSTSYKACFYQSFLSFHTLTLFQSFTHAQATSKPSNLLSISQSHNLRAPLLNLFIPSVPHISKKGHTKIPLLYGLRLETLTFLNTFKLNKVRK